MQINTETQAEALGRAKHGQSFSNYPAIIEGFSAKGIPEADIKPRENVFTYHAWRALGRTVRRGEHGVRVCTYIPITSASEDETSPADTVTTLRRKMATVFHISQTDSLNGVNG